MKIEISWLIKRIEQFFYNIYNPKELMDFRMQGQRHKVLTLNITKVPWQTVWLVLRRCPESLLDRYCLDSKAP